jgi:hypothetical protein
MAMRFQGKEVVHAVESPYNLRVRNNGRCYG